MSARCNFAALARSFAGLSCAGAGKARYDALICATGFDTTSGCALVVRGLWRLFFSTPHERITRDYVAGQALADLRMAARAADAVRRPGASMAIPELGDVVHLGGYAGQPEHVWTCVDPEVHDGAVLGLDGAVLGLDGGRRDDAGHESIESVEHCLSWLGTGLWDRGRPVVEWYDLDALAAAWGVANGGAAVPRSH